ncbi:putative repeat protein (TIGR01451 family)/gliding motility-associated-like protein [Chitinophaga skermanii]|uniref:Putative repeat protein (TIGR01451 family)/gliding motility-associated-like protein n=1 Tax=Chitinophaga skermanii TaxID=331697 RepID=A0A327QM94_9BACT|nr:gliding motility-associated C-terminal domain-containing protein [Chitinophaga skermanii]RAJ05381.1 putative repeat protein (TIGR01451 family)/gliding motility-associated-like protein [Chitinophaga skermanii]
MIVKRLRHVITSHLLRNATPTAKVLLPLMVVGLLLMAWPSSLFAQQCTGSLGDPVFKETFGNAGTTVKPTLGGPLPNGVTNYTYFSPQTQPNMSEGPYPGQYTISNSTYGYRNHYFVDRPDHTSGDGTGYCMVVDAQATPGQFYERTITGLCAGTTFEFSAWIMNINPNTSSSKPSLRFDIYDANNPNGTPIATVSTGEVAYQSPGTWVRLAGMFQMPSTTSTVILRIFSNTPSSQGNDLALDDIAFAACGPPFVFTQQAGIVCAGGTALMNVSLPAGSYSQYFFQLQKRAIGTEAWSDEGGVINNGTNNAYTFTINNAQGGFEYRVVAAGGRSEMGNVNCRVVSDPLELKIIDFSMSITGTPAICSGTSTTLNAVVTPTPGTGTPTTGFTYTWETSTTGTGGWTVVSGQTGATLNTGVLTANRYYRVSAVVNGCSGSGASAAYLVTVNPAVSVTMPTETTICEGTPIVQIPYTATSGTPDRYTIRGQGVPGFTDIVNATLTGSPIRATVPNGLPAGIYNFTIQFSNSATGCNSPAIPLILHVDGAPTVAAAGPDQTLCATTTATMAANVATVGAGVWLQISGPNTAIITTPNSPTTTMTGLVPGSYVFQWRIANGVCISTFDNVTINITPATTIANAGADITQYNSGVFNLMANTPVNGTGAWSVISGSATLGSTTNPRTTATIGVNTSATLVWTITNGICPPSSDTVVITYTSRADIQVTKVVRENGPYLAGQDIQYDMVILNAGPSNATNVQITDAIPANVIVSNVSVGAVGAATIVQNNSTNTNVSVIANIPTGASRIVVVVEGKINPAFEGDLTNTITAVSTDVPDPDGATATVTIPVVRRPFMTLEKNAPASVAAGESMQFTIAVENDGLGDAIGTVITDAVSNKLTNVTWSATATGRQSIVSGATGSGNTISIMANMPAGDTGKVYITINGTVRADATGTIENVAVANPAEVTVGETTSNTTHTVITSSLGLVIDKSHVGNIIGTAGLPVTYVLKVFNNGPSNAVNTRILDTIPANFTNVTWSTQVVGAAAVTAGATGSGNIVDVRANIPAGNSNIVAVTITATVNPSFAGNITNTAYAIPAEVGAETVSDIDMLTVRKQMAFTAQKSGPATAIAGEQISYTIDVTNGGPSNSTATVIRDNIPAAIYNVTWTASVLSGTATITAGATGSTNNVAVTANMNANAVIRIIVSGTILPQTTATIKNTASVTPSEANVSSVNSNEVVTTLESAAVLSITKSGPATASAGNTITYILRATNNGPSFARDFVINDVVPSSITDVSWVVNSAGNASVNSLKGIGNNIQVTTSLAPGANNYVEIVVTGTINPSFQGTITNTATVVPTEPNSTGDTASQVTVVSRTPELRISKATTRLVAAGDSIHYRINVINISTSDALNAFISDTVPGSIAGVRWSAVAEGNASIIGATSGSGNIIGVNGNIPSGQNNRIVLIISGITSPAFDGRIVNTGYALTAETGVQILDTAISLVRKIPTINITKSGPAIANAGEKIVYTVVVDNTSLSDADNLVIQDDVPAMVQNVTWTTSTKGDVVISTGATGSGNNVGLSAHIGGGGNSQIVITITGTIDPTFTGNIVNTAAALPSEPGATPANAEPVITVVNKAVNLRIRKAGPSSVNAGVEVPYAIVVTNTGPSAAVNTVITDVIPAQLQDIYWRAHGTNGANITSDSTGDSHTISITANIPVGGYINIEAGGIVPASVTSDTLYNVATADPAEAGSATVASDTIVTIVAQRPDISIIKVGPSDASAGETILYGIRVVNFGPSDAKGVVITDTIPANISNVAWATVTAGNASIITGAKGTGNILRIVADIPAGETNIVIVAIEGKIDPTFAGTIVNDAYANPNVPGFNTLHSQVSTVVARKANVSISKVGPANIAAGEQIQYTIEATNSGPSYANNITITDAIPAAVINASWVATVQGGAVISSAASGTGNVSLNGNIPTTGKISIVVTGTVDPNTTVTSITNTAILRNDPAWTNTPGDTSSVTTNIAYVANLRINKAGPANHAAGEAIEYVITVENDGPTNVKGAVISDILPAAILNGSWMAVGNGNIANISPASGSGNVNLTADIPADGSTLTIVVSGIMSPAVVNGSSIINTATVNLPTGTIITDPNPADNTSTITTIVDNNPVVRISKTGPASVIVNDTIVYRIVVTNGGSGNITNAVITDNVPNTIQVVSWNALATGVASITGAASGNTNTVSTTADIPVGPLNTVVVTIRGIVTNTAGNIITNTATVVAGGTTVSSTTSAQNTATDVRIVKSGPQTAIAGEAISYRLQIFNNGPRNVNDLQITDIIPAVITNVSWQAIATGNASIMDSVHIDSTGNTINIPGKIAAGAANYITIYISGTVSGTTTATTVTNTANVTVNDVSDYNLSNNTSSVTTTITRQFGLAIDKTGPLTAQSGTNVSYQIKVTNDGPSDAIGVNINDLVPTDIINTQWQVAVQGGAQVTGPFNGTGNTVNTTGNIPAGAGNVIVVTVTGTVNNDFDGTITNIATAGNAVIPTIADTARTVVTRKTGLVAAKSGPNEITAGDRITYVITVSNGGPAFARNVNITDTIDSRITNVAWVATGTNGAVINSGAVGTGHQVLVNADIPPTDTAVVRIVVTGVVPSDASGVITNTATITPPGIVNPPIITPPIITPIDRLPELSISKTGPTAVAAGGTIHYVLLVTNDGLSDAVGATISDLVPSTISQVSWTATANQNATITAGAAGNGNNISVIATIPPKGTVQIAIDGKVDSTYVGTLLNSAYVRPAEPGSNSDSSQVVTSVSRRPGVRITKSGPARLSSGAAITYVINATNIGPSAALNASIHDAVPTAIKNVTWTATTQGMASIIGAASGTGNVVSLNGNIAPGTGNSIRVTVNGTVDAAFRDTLYNRAIITPADTGVVADTSGTVVTVIVPQPNIIISKDGPNTAIAGQGIQYTITVGNVGLSNAVGTIITDSIPADITNITWTAQTNGVATITGATSGTGNNISTTANIPAGNNNKIVIQVNGTVSPTFVGTIVNKASAKPAEIGVAEKFAQVTTNVAAKANLQIAKTGPTTMIRGTQVTYIVAVRNVGPSDAVGAVVTDTVPNVLTNVTWSTLLFRSASVTTGATGSGNLINLTANLPASDSSAVLLVIAGTVRQDAPDGSVINVGYVTNNGELKASREVVSLIRGATDLAITKTAPVEAFITNTISYQVTVTNNGPSDANGAMMKDVLPNGLTQATVQVTNTTGGAANITTSIQNNSITATLGTFPANASVVFTITAVANTQGNLVNVATINTPTGMNDTDSSNNIASATTLILPKSALSIDKSIEPAGGPYNIGSTLTYKIHITNNGVRAINPVVVVDKLPAANLVSDPTYNTPPRGTASYNAGARTLTWNVGLLNAGESLDWQYNMVLLAEGEVKNTALVTGPPGVSTPDTSIVTINTVRYANLKVVKVLNTPTPLKVNQIMQFTITATNQGPDTATNIIVSDIFANNIGNPSNITVSVGQTSFDATTRRFTWSIPRLNNGVSATLVYSAKLNSGGNVSNTATIAGKEIDVDLTDNTSTITADISDDFFIPNIITPNGDGKNDKFVIPGLDRYPGSALTIYNRWGNQVYQNKNYDNSWDGNGLNESTYYYVLQLRSSTGEVKIVKGWIELVR